MRTTSSLVEVGNGNFGSVSSDWALVLTGSTVSISAKRTVMVVALFHCRWHRDFSVDAVATAPVVGDNEDSGNDYADEQKGMDKSKGTTGEEKEEEEEENDDDYSDDDDDQ